MRFLQNNLTKNRFRTQRSSLLHKKPRKFRFTFLDERLIMMVFRIYYEKELSSLETQNESAVTNETQNESAATNEPYESAATNETQNESAATN